MTKEEYIKTLKENLSTLPQDELNSALEFYQGYFDDAQDEQQAMETLGSPEEVAQQILKEIASVPQTTGNQNSSSGNSHNSGNSDSTNSSNSEYDSSREFKTSATRDGTRTEAFDVQQIKNIDLRLKLSDFNIVPDAEFFLESDDDYLNASVIQNGDTLTISSPDKKIRKGFSIFGITIGTDNPDLTLHVPQSLMLDSFKAEVGMGNLKADNCNIMAKTVNISVGSGNVKLSSIHCTEGINAACSMGNINIQGDIKGNSKISCGMGAVYLQLKGNPEEYSVQGSVGMGSLNFNGVSQTNGIGSFSQEPKKNNFKISVGMGSVKVKFI